MGNSHVPEALLTVIRPPQYIMNHHGSGYSEHIIGCILCYPIMVATSHSTMPDALDITMQISGEILGIIYAIICEVAFH